MQSQMKEIQKSLAKKTAEFTAEGGLVKAVARGDMTIEAVRIDPKAITGLKPEKLEKAVTIAVNGALSAAKDMAAAEMSQMAGGLGLDGLLGGS